MTRLVGVFVALCLLAWLGLVFVQALRTYPATGSSGYSHFLWQQIVPVYLPYFALLLLLLVPFSRVRRSTMWTALLVATALLSLWWFVPVAYRSIAHPTIHVEAPAGTPEGVVAPRILITRSYDELRYVLMIAGFLLTQILAIWYARRQAAGRIEMGSGVRAD